MSIRIYTLVNYSNTDADISTSIRIKQLRMSYFTRFLNDNFAFSKLLMNINNIIFVLVNCVYAVKKRILLIDLIVPYWICVLSNVTSKLFKQ